MVQRVPEARPLQGDVGETSAQKRYMERITDMFTVDVHRLQTISNHLMKEMDTGLNKDNHTVPMIPSFVEGRITGDEQGQFLALDLGGTNLRVVLATLHGNGKYKTTSSKWLLTEDLKTGPMRQLCDYIAECIDEFLTEHGLSQNETPLYLGYTFSFPVNQSGINRGVLKYWTKGFSCPGAVGKDPVMLLQDALLRKNIAVRVAALINDTVGTLLCNAYQKSDTTIGMILGTGMNGAYVEQMANIGKWRGARNALAMVINMELGSLDSECIVLPITPFDCQLDRQSINPRQQMFEKLMSGMYLGEIVRNILLDMVDRELIFGPAHRRFNQKAWAKDLSRQYAFETSYMSVIENDDTPDLSKTKEVLDLHLNLPGVTTNECRVIKRLCELVGIRAARLAAAVIAGIVKHCGVSAETGTTVGIDGSLYEFYPSFQDRLYDALQELLPEFSNVRNTVRINLAKDGSGLGAALAACVAARMEKNKPVAVAIP